MIGSKNRIYPALVVMATAFISACGSDSTGPGSIDSNAALQSLSLGLQGVGVPVPQSNASFGGIAPLLDQVTVTIDGASQTMFGLGFRETFPEGTCIETLFVDPAFPPEPGVCTPPPTKLILVLWQSHSANRRPERMVVILADTGTKNFDFAADDLASEPSYELPLDFVFALYVQGEDDIWGSLSGTLTSHVAATTQGCNLPLPPYAKAGVCNIATFDEQASIVFEQFDPDAPTIKHLNLAIPRQTFHGLLQAISEVQPIQISTNWSYNGLATPQRMSLAQEIARAAITRAAPRAIRAR